MPEKPQNEDADDIRARFARLQALEDDAPVEDDLPPVPQVKIDRPARVALPGEPNYGAQGGGKIPARGMMGSGDMRSSGAALTIGTSLVASIVVGTGFGWLIDHYVLHSTTTPWGLIIGFLIGVASGFLNLIRVTNRLNK